MKGINIPFITIPSISNNHNLTMESIEKYTKISWLCDRKSRAHNITMENIETYPDMPWDWEYISSEPNITIDFIEKYSDKIYFRCLSKNKFTYENKQLKKKESYWLLEKIQAFNKLENLVILEKYM